MSISSATISSILKGSGLVEHPGFGKSHDVDGVGLSQGFEEVVVGSSGHFLFVGCALSQWKYKIFIFTKHLYIIYCHGC